MNRSGVNISGLWGNTSKPVQYIYILGVDRYWDSLSSHTIGRCKLSSESLQQFTKSLTEVGLMQMCGKLALSTPAPQPRDLRFNLITLQFSRRAHDATFHVRRCCLPQNSVTGSHQWVVAWSEMKSWMEWKVGEKSAKHAHIRWYWQKRGIKDVYTAKSDFLYKR